MDAAPRWLSARDWDLAGQGTSPPSPTMPNEKTGPSSVQLLFSGEAWKTPLFKTLYEPMTIVFNRDAGNNTEKWHFVRSIQLSGKPVASFRDYSFLRTSLIKAL